MRPACSKTRAKARISLAENSRVRAPFLAVLSAAEKLADAPLGAKVRLLGARPLPSDFRLARPGELAAGWRRRADWQSMSWAWPECSAQSQRSARWVCAHEDSHGIFPAVDTSTLTQTTPPLRTVREANGLSLRELALSDRHRRGPSFSGRARYRPCCRFVRSRGSHTSSACVSSTRLLSQYDISPANGAKKSESPPRRAQGSRDKDSDGQGYHG